MARSTSSAHLAHASKAAAGLSTTRKSCIASSELDVNNDNLFVPGDDAGDEDEEEAADLLHVTVEGTSPPKNMEMPHWLQLEMCMHFSI